MASLIILEGPKYSGKSYVRDKLYSAGFTGLCVDYGDIMFSKDRDAGEDKIAFMLGSCVMMAENWKLDCNLVSDRNFLSICFYHRYRVEGIFYDLWLKAISRWDNKCIYVLESPEYLEEIERINRRSIIKNNRDLVYSDEYREEEKKFYSDIKRRFGDHSLFYFGSSDKVLEDIVTRFNIKV